MFHRKLPSSTINPPKIILIMCILSCLELCVYFREIRCQVYTYFDVSRTHTIYTDYDTVLQPYSVDIMHKTTRLEPLLSLWLLVWSKTLTSGGLSLCKDKLQEWTNPAFCNLALKPINLGLVACRTWVTLLQFWFCSLGVLPGRLISCHGGVIP